MFLRLGDVMTGPSSLDAPGFMGGSPHVPTGFAIPVSALTRAPMAFMFQIVFDAAHVLAGNTLAVFLALDDADENLIIPPLSAGDLSRMPVDDAAIASQQQTYAALLFKTGECHRSNEIVSPVAPVWLQETSGDDQELFGTTDPGPFWVLDDETPGPLSGEDPIFALQVVEEFQFPKRPDAPAQIVVDYFAAEGKAPRKEPAYEMFAGNQIFFFAYPRHGKVAVGVQGQ